MPSHVPLFCCEETGQPLRSSSRSMELAVTSSSTFLKMVDRLSQYRSSQETVANNHRPSKAPSREMPEPRLELLATRLCEDLPSVAKSSAFGRDQVSAVQLAPAGTRNARIDSANGISISPGASTASIADIGHNFVIAQEDLLCRPSKSPLPKPWWLPCGVEIGPRAFSTYSDLGQSSLSAA